MDSSIQTHAHIHNFTSKPTSSTCNTPILFADNLDLMPCSQSEAPTNDRDQSNRVSPFSTINPFMYAPHSHIQTHTDIEYDRLGLLSLAWSLAIIEPTMELVTNGPHRWDGIIVQTMEHFKSKRGVALWPAGESRERERRKKERGENMGEESNYRHHWEAMER